MCSRIRDNLQHEQVHSMNFPYAHSHKPLLQMHTMFVWTWGAQTMLKWPAFAPIAPLRGLVRDTVTNMRCHYTAKPASVPRCPPGKAKPSQRQPVTKHRGRCRGWGTPQWTLEHAPEGNEANCMGQNQPHCWRLWISELHAFLFVCLFSFCFALFCFSALSWFNMFITWTAGTLR